MKKKHNLFKSHLVGFRRSVWLKFPDLTYEWFDGLIADLSLAKAIAISKSNLWDPAICKRFSHIFRIKLD